MSDQSQIKMTPELEKAILEATSVSAISSLMRDAAIEQHLVQESDDPFFLKSVAPGTADRAKKEVRIVNLNNKKYYIEAESGNTASLDRQEADLYRKIFAEAPAAQQPQRDDRGRFVEQPVEETETVAERLEREMVEKALARQGISIDTLREIEADKQSKADMQTWESAAEEFRNSPLGSLWPGGQKNKNTMGRVVSEVLGLSDEPTAATLAKAYEYMKQNGLVAPNEEFEQEKNIKSANSYEDLKRAIGYRGDSGMFGH